MSRPLDGLQLLEVGGARWSAYAGRLLGLLGASVSRVDAGPPDPVLDAGKVTLVGPDARRLGAHAVLDASGGAPGRGDDDVVTVRHPPEPSPADDWAASGAMALTGPPDGAPLVAPGHLAAHARGAAAAVELLSALVGRRVRVDGPALLGERAALADLGRRGRQTCGGAGRLVPAVDGWAAFGLPRSDDRALVPAWLGLDREPEGGAVGAWAAVERESARWPVADLVARARMLGLPAAALAEPEDAGTDAVAAARGQSFPPSPWLLDGDAPVAPRPTTRARIVPPSRPWPRAGPLVVDLTGLWAGPLCAHLLGLAGARVVKVEDVDRLDGARSGPPDFYDLLHAGHRSVVLRFADPGDRARLADLLTGADVVLEASRPRALDSLGLGPDAIVPRNPDVVWCSITGYGRTGPGRQWAALGDDAAVAAGLVVPGPDGTPCFCADADADPLTGLHAAVAVLAARLGGRGRRVDVAMREVVGHALLDVPRRPERPAAPPAVPVAPPRARVPAGRAAPPGADTAAVLAEVVGRAAGPVGAVSRAAGTRGPSPRSGPG